MGGKVIVLMNSDSGLFFLAMEDISVPCMGSVCHDECKKSNIAATYEPPPALLGKKNKKKQTMEKMRRDRFHEQNRNPSIISSIGVCFLC